MAADVYKKHFQSLKARGGGQVVSVLTFYSHDPSSNGTEVYHFSLKIVVEKKERKKEIRARYRTD